MTGVSSVPYDERKQDVLHVEEAAGELGSSGDSDKGDPHMRKLGIDIDEGFDPAEVKRVTRKVDWRLIPMLILMYAISLIDRTNLSVARTANNNKFDEELGTGGTNNRYSIITLVFFVPYIIFELPSQFGLRRFGARIWLGSAVVLWGIVMRTSSSSRSWCIVWLWLTSSGHGFRHKLDYPRCTPCRPRSLRVGSFPRSGVPYFLLVPTQGTCIPQRRILHLIGYRFVFRQAYRLRLLPP